ncbi:unnamed protein product [Orchesella dallaii]|uniref:Uncharacterized protein n=1 Tax=Orchesella dallaii TaxID=48710 RepID=A0ABP1PUQ2_9HEXA
MFPIKSLLVVVSVTVFSLSKESCCIQQNVSERSARQNNVNVKPSANSPSSYSLSPSFSYQFHTNDHEHLDQIVSAHHSVVPNSFNSDDATKVQTQDNVASASTNQATNLNAVPPPTYYYPTLDLSSHPRQENTTSENSKQSRIPERKEQLKQPQQNRDSAPEAFTNQKYTAQAIQVGATVPSIPTTSTSYQQPGKQSTGSNPTWNPIVKESHETSSSVYLRPSKNHQRANNSPVSHQKRQSIQHIASSYSHTNAVPQPSATLASMRSMSTHPEAQKPIVKGKSNRRKILQSRADTYAQDEEGEMDEQNDNGENEETHEDDQEQEQDVDNNDEYQSQYNNVYDPLNPHLRDFGFPPEGAFGGSPFTGPGGPLDALPPPPPPLKGSIDYILIPLILIGLAGPIFVVLYVILGAFEARLSPIQRSLNTGYSDYKPYIDSITSSVGRALEQYECFDYAVCRFSGISSDIGLSRTTTATIESALTSVTPKEYLPILRNLFSIMETPKKNCNKYKCSAMADQLPVNF